MDSNQPQYRPHSLHGEGRYLLTSSLALQISVFIVLTARIISRRMIPAGLGADDWVIMVSIAFDVVMSSLAIADVYFGYGNPSSSLSPSDRIIVLQIFWLFQIVYKVVINSCKISFCLFFTRIISRGNKAFRYSNLTVMTIITTYSVASFVTTIVQCNPVSRAWDRSVDGTCIDLTAFWYSGAVYSITTDFLIIALPLFICWHLKISKHDKAFLCVIFSAGFVVIGMSIARVMTLDVSSKTLDPSAGTYISTRWTVGEANVMIMIACVPSLKPSATWIYLRCKSWVESKYLKRDSLPSNTAHEGWRASSMDFREIAIRTDVDVEFEEKSRESSMLNASRHDTVVQAREIA